jgi:hypothetical protein
VSKRRDQDGLAALATRKQAGANAAPVRRTQEGAPASANAHEQAKKCSTKKSRTLCGGTAHWTAPGFAPAEDGAFHGALDHCPEGTLVQAGPLPTMPTPAPPTCCGRPPVQNDPRSGVR